MLVFKPSVWSMGYRRCPHMYPRGPHDFHATTFYRGPEIRVRLFETKKNPAQHDMGPHTTREAGWTSVVGSVRVSSLHARTKHNCTNKPHCVVTKAAAAVGVHRRGPRRERERIWALSLSFDQEPPRLVLIPSVSKWDDTIGSMQQAQAAKVTWDQYQRRPPAKLRHATAMVKRPRARR